MMKTSYDPGSDAFYARFAPDDIEISDTREVAPGVTIDVDATGQIVGFEVLSVKVRSAGIYGQSLMHSAAE